MTSSRPLRVLGICDYIGPVRSGGAERVTTEVMARLSSDDDVWLVGGHPHVARRYETRVGDAAASVLPGRDVSRLLGGQSMLTPGLRTEAMTLIRERAPDVLYASSLHFHSTIVAARLAGRFGLPLVIHAHLGPVDALAPRLRLMTTAYEKTIGRWLARRASRLIAVSEAVRSHLIEVGAARGDVVVVPNGVDMVHFQPSRRDANHRRPDRIVFVGRHISNKGPDVALDAFEILADSAATLTFIGEGPMRRALEAAVVDRNLDDRVRFLGDVGDVARALGNADILVRPSTTEGQSLAILEAMACGLCVVASDISANRELITHGVDGVLVTPRDPGALAAALADLFREPSRTREIGQRARRRAARHDWDRCAEGVRATLTAAVGDP